MTELRAEIDRLDRELVALLAERRGYIERAAELKRGNGWPARIEERVEEVVARARASAAAHELDPDLVEALWRRLIDWSIALEESRLGAKG
ncbi:chorismate mutase [Amaricoccus solimangrovi]|uniref:chorismate mutase n=2 Tax=Amaricoccus solimangrovi TaxID=2589815 RepID=A0A501WYR6_9RHOB|nr:chorismate mutase [Amaricoccus solimangrovi]